MAIFTSHFGVDLIQRETCYRMIESSALPLLVATHAVFIKPLEILLCPVTSSTRKKCMISCQSKSCATKVAEGVARLTAVALGAVALLRVTGVTLLFTMN